MGMIVSYNHPYYKRTPQAFNFAFTNLKLGYLPAFYKNGVFFMLPSLRTLLLSKKWLLTYVVSLCLLFVSFFGFWYLAQLGNSADPTQFTRAFILGGAGILPLLIIMAMAVRMAAGVGQSLSSVGYQFRLDQLQKRLNAQDDFFRAINDYTPSALTIFNNASEYWFVNAAAAQILGGAGNSALGKKPSGVLGLDTGKKIEKSLDYVREHKKPLEILNQDTDKFGQPRYMQTSYQLLEAFGDFPGGIMAREENVTTILVERERRENMLRQVLSTLVAVVDRRDPYAAGHSARVGQLSRAMAIELQLTEREIDAAEIAGSLMNFGKVLVSRAILTKTEALTQEELQRIRDGILTSADILSLIDFSTPVVPTLRQVLERHDGTGVPFGLRGDSILMTARIVAVANAFVAMVSPRAYRPGAEFSLAAKRLAGDANKAFDPRVITTLETFLERNKHKLEWLAVKQQASAALAPSTPQS
jgi:HD-GYP domain-containing protein (c-di-GMP phosphodiesterase class II)